MSTPAWPPDPNDTSYEIWRELVFRGPWHEANRQWSALSDQWQSGELDEQEYERLLSEHFDQFEDVLDLWRQQVWPNELVLEFCSRLFLEAADLPNQFAEDELQEGLWSLGGADGWLLGKELWFPRHRLDTRLAFVENSYVLFRDLFQLNPLTDVCTMWWDSFAPPDRGAESEMMDAVFEVLVRILNTLATPACIRSALHGLEHLGHPAGLATITSWLADNPDLAPELREYALYIAESQPGFKHA